MLAYKKLFSDLFEEVREVVVGQDQVVEQIMVAILADGNALLEGYPGLAKTLTVRTLAKIMDLRFSRIQFTPDLMPSDITGTYVIEEHSSKREFKFHPGPIFANIVLADEINRASPKTQSALLESMQEKQVTVGNTTYKLDQPFFVLATQNPIEQEGSLALNQHVFVNGTLKTGAELLEKVHEPLKEDEQGMKLYDIDAWTFSLTPAGTLEKTKCLLYTLPYNDELISLTTNTGKMLTVTKNHPLLVNDKGIIVWKKAEDLTKNDYLVNPAKLDLEGNPKILTHQETVKKMQYRDLPEEIHLDKDFAFWSAFFLSTGYTDDSYVAACEKNSCTAIDKFITLSRKYGFKPKVSINGDRTYVKIYSKSLVEYLNLRFGIRNGNIPVWFLNLPEEMNREFLRTFISLNSSTSKNGIALIQTEANLNLISYMLLREGIVSCITKNNRTCRMEIQGTDIVKYSKKIGCIYTHQISLPHEITSDRVVPVERKVILNLAELLDLNRLHTAKENLASRDWYCSYKRIKEGETLMRADSLKKMVKDLEKEVQLRCNSDFLEQFGNLRFSSELPTIALSGKVALTHFLNKKRDIEQTLQAQSSVLKQQLRLTRARSLLNYLKGLLSEHVFYDKIKSIYYSKSEGTAFGLTVPKLQNYLGGFGGCGINHNTYPLPEAQSDRFLLKIQASYPTYDEEIEIVNKYAYELSEKRLKVAMNKENLIDLQQLTRQVPIATDLKEEAVKLVTSTRNQKGTIEYGASPRASIGLVIAAKARALLNGRNHVSSDDIKSVAFPVLRHRILLNFEAERKGMTPDDVIKTLVDKIKK